MAETAGAPATAPRIDWGDARAIYETHVGYVWNSLRRLGISDADREDLCHEVFLIFFRGTTFDPTRPLRPWLFGIAFRVASDHRRRARFRREVHAPVEETPSPHLPADEALLRKEARRLVENGLAALDLDQRAVFILHEIEGLPMPEIARTLDAPLNTLYSRLRLGRRKFEAAVQRAVLGTPPRGTAAMGGR
jgi:RNA polymerase sigma-70 factor (ECF subfamily)